MTSVEQRKTVTVVFCDLAGSTALGETVDPERLRALLARYFEEMRTIVEHHGGTVEKFIGDAVMAVFGVPVLHEDDALRAVRAAAEMRDALPDLGLEGRIGVMTGEVVTGTVERLATGDAVNVAARLEQAAAPGEVLIGQPTLALVGGAVEAERVEPLALKGKAEPVVAHRLLRVHDAPERRHDTLFVGRDRELAAVRDAWDRAITEKRCELVTVVGDPGVGKSRLVAEAVASFDARIVRGRCLPYGEGITYWPVVEVLKQLDVSPDDEDAAAAIRTLLGESDATTSAEEIAWAFRKTLEQIAVERPLAVVFDDIQWGEDGFRDLIEHAALLSTGAPILLLCMARPELVVQRPDWVVTVRLEPLTDDDVDELLPRELPGELRARIRRASGGNPLFVHEILGMADESDGEVVVPPTLQALLAARLDQLGSAERGVLERGSIEGEVFHRGAVQALTSDADGVVTPRLAALVRKQLIAPDAPVVPGEDGFRFRHLLVRDAAYDSLTKATRAGLHERFATWLEHHGADLVELDEIVGYHLEQACRYRDELGLPVDTVLAADARRHLALAGGRALGRSDYGAAAGLLERAVDAMPDGEIDLTVETMLIDALYWKGEGEKALQRANALTERAVAAGNGVAELSGEIQSAVLRTYLESEAGAETLVALVEQALGPFEAARSEVALFTAHHAVGWVEFGRAHMDVALAAFERASTHAARAGLPYELLGWRAICVADGSMPCPRALDWFATNAVRGGRDYLFRGAHAVVLAMMTRFDEARTILAGSREELAERGAGITLATLTGIESTMVELLAGDPVAAVRFASDGCRALESLDDLGFLSTAAAEHACALYELGRVDEAAIWARRSAEIGSNDDVFTQIGWRKTHARVLARRGEVAEAEIAAREGVAIAEGTEWLVGQGDASMTLAEVLQVSGRTQEALAALEQALERYERKGNVVMAQRCRERLAKLREPG